MPKGPQGQKRPVSDRACTVHVMKIATGQIEEKLDRPLPPLTPLTPPVTDDSPPVDEDGRPLVAVEIPVYGSGIPFPNE